MEMASDINDAEQEQATENQLASISRLTPDVLHEILLRLPVSTLQRLCRTCHQWRGVISDPCFIMDHANRAPEHLLLFLPRLDASASLKTAMPGRVKLFDEKWSVSTWAASSMDPDDHLFACCNGLLCFYRKYTLKIVNPATGQRLHLSKPDGRSPRDLYYLYSFGFHPATGEYKLVYFLREPRHGRSSGQPFRFDAIQVHTLGEDGWRDVRAPRESCLVNLGVVNVDGAMYWISEEEGACCGAAVMAFDLKDETFVTLRPPPLRACGVATDGPCGAPALSYYVTEVEKKVCLVTAPFSSSAPRWRRYNAEVSGRMDVWTLESRGEDRWSLKYSVDLSPSAPRCVPQPCFVRGGKVLLHGRDGDAFCRDLRGDEDGGEEVRLLNFRPYRYYETQAYLYKETLVPLDVYAGAAIARAPHWPLPPPAS